VGFLTVVSQGMHPVLPSSNLLCKATAGELRVSRADLVELLDTHVAKLLTSQGAPPELARLSLVLCAERQVRAAGHTACVPLVVCCAAPVGFCCCAPRGAASRAQHDACNDLVLHAAPGAQAG
jgi:hypothetical protein